MLRKIARANGVLIPDDVEFHVDETGEFQKGAITADHLAAQCIRMIDPEDPGLVLSDLPNSILDRKLA